jgi:hypothetical protein
MVNTRNCVAVNNAENNGESNNQEANLPPPPPLTLEQVLAMQAQMLGDFQRTKPPTFSYAVEPMDTDD